MKKQTLFLSLVALLLVLGNVDMWAQTSNEEQNQSTDTKVVTKKVIPAYSQDTPRPTPQLRSSSARPCAKAVPASIQPITPAPSTPTVQKANLKSNIKTLETKISYLRQREGVNPALIEKHERTLALRKQQLATLEQQQSKTPTNEK